MVWNFEPDSQDNVLITRTIPAVAAKRNKLGRVFASYEAIPTGDAYLTITWTRNTVVEALVLSMNIAGPVPLDFTDFVIGDPNTAITLTLTQSGVGGNIAKLNTFFGVD